MMPSINQVMAVLMERIQADALPALGDNYAGQQLQRGVLLMQCMLEEFDRAAARRVDEVRSLREVFEQALPQVDEPVLAAQLAAILAQPEDNAPAALSVAALDLRMHALRALLTQLHQWSEISGAAGAQQVNLGIWQELRASTERRKLSIDRM